MSEHTLFKWVAEELKWDEPRTTSVGGQRRTLKCIAACQTPRPRLSRQQRGACTYILIRISCQYRSLFNQWLVASLEIIFQLLTPASIFLIYHDMQLKICWKTNWAKLWNTRLGLDWLSCQSSFDLVEPTAMVPWRGRQINGGSFAGLVM